MTRKDKLEKCGWTIFAAQSDHIFVAETSQGDREVLFFYFDALDDTPMVEGYFASSFKGRALGKLYDAPDEFVKEFYFYCANAIPDWYIKEELFFKTINAFNAAYHEAEGDKKG